MTRARGLFLLARIKLLKFYAPIRNYFYAPPVFLIHPDPLLSRRAEEVDFKKYSRKKLVKIVKKMDWALKATGYGDKLGIAATQIGIPLRIMIVQGAVIINPTWQPSKAPPNQSVEGCYSVPHKLYQVSRAPVGWATWVSIDGTPRKYKLNGLNAIIYQHELDHLDGKCCADVGKLIEDNSPKMAKFKVTSEFVLNGITHKKGEVIELDHKYANLKSIQGNIEKFDPNAPVGDKVVPAPQNAPETPKVEEAPVQAPAPAPVEPEKAPEPEVPAPAPSSPETQTPAPEADKNTPPLNDEVPGGSVPPQA